MAIIFLSSLFRRTKGDSTFPVFANSQWRNRRSFLGQALGSTLARWYCRREESLLQGNLQPRPYCPSNVGRIESGPFTLQWYIETVPGAYNQCVLGDNEPLLCASAQSSTKMDQICLPKDSFGDCLCLLHWFPRVSRRHQGLLKTSPLKKFLILAEVFIAIQSNDL